MGPHVERIDDTDRRCPHEQISRGWMARASSWSIDPLQREPYCDRAGGIVLSVDFGTKIGGRVFMGRGGYRRRYIEPNWDARTWCAGRWGPRRVRVTECAMMLTAEQAYTELLRSELFYKYQGCTPAPVGRGHDYSRIDCCGPTLVRTVQCRPSAQSRWIAE